MMSDSLKKQPTTVRKSVAKSQERRKQIRRHLATYATAAAATNVALSESVNADVVFEDIDDVMIVENAVGQGVVVGFDLDGNGTVDLNIGHQQTSPGIGAAVAYIPESLLPTNAIVATGSGVDANGMGDPFYIRNLVSSTRINASLTPWAKPTLQPNSRGDLGYLAFGNASPSCPDCEFPAGVTGYLGVQFDADGTTNYGWVRLGVSDAPLNKITVFSIAYDNMGNGIHVPEPGGLGLLALGGIGVAMMRRRRKETNDSAAE